MFVMNRPVERSITTNCSVIYVSATSELASPFIQIKDVVYCNLNNIQMAMTNTKDVI